MKKILFALICIFMLPVIVYADYGLPTTYKYDVIITNKNGAIVYEESNSNVKEYKASTEKIAYNTKATVVLENYYKGKYYLRVGVNGDTDWDNQKWILWDDAKIVDEKVELNDNDNNTTKKTGYFYTILDTKMYKGPSSLYGEIKDVTIPKGTLIEYDYVIDDTDNGIPMWIHVKYEKTEGYVYCYNWFSGTDDQLNDLPVTVAEPLAAPMKILTLGEMDIYSYNGVVSESKKIGTIPKGTKIEFTYSINSGIKSTYYYVEYNDIKGWVNLYTGYCGGCDSDYGEFQAGEYFVMDDIKLYNNYTDEKEVGILPFESIIEGGIYTFYIFEDNTETMEFGTKYAYIEYKGKGYYIKDKDIENISIYTTNYDFSKKYEIKLKTFAELYTSPFNLYETPALYTIPADTKLTSIVKANVTNGVTGGKHWYLVEYEATDEHGLPVQYQGWIRLTDDEANIKELEASPDSFNINCLNAKKRNPLVIGLISAGIAIIITVLAAVIIVKINKNKKKKEL